jgi:hypothetical protein
VARREEETLEFPWVNLNNINNILRSRSCIPCSAYLACKCRPKSTITSTHLNKLLPKGSSSFIPEGFLVTEGRCCEANTREMFIEHILLVASTVMNPSCSCTTFTKAPSNVNNIVISRPTLGQFFAITKLDGVIGRSGATRGRLPNGNGW